MQSKFDWFLEEFNNSSESNKIAMYNEFCERNHYDEDMIYSMNEFDDILINYSQSEIFRMVSYTNANYNDNYFVSTIYGIETFNDPNKKIEYYLEDIYLYGDIWQKYIDIDSFKAKVFDEYIELKPTNMNNNDFYEIVSDAVELNDNIIDYYINNEIEKQTK